MVNTITHDWHFVTSKFANFYLVNLENYFTFKNEIPFCCNKFKFLTLAWKDSLPDVLESVRAGHFKTFDKGVVESSFFTQVVKKIF